MIRYCMAPPSPALTGRQPVGNTWAQLKNAKRRRSKSAVPFASKLGYLGRNIRTLNHLLDAYETIPLGKKERKYFYVIQTVNPGFL
jgi:hypothetical protein